MNLEEQKELEAENKLNITNDSHSRIILYLGKEFSIVNYII